MIEQYIDQIEKAKELGYSWPDIGHRRAEKKRKSVFAEKHGLKESSGDNFWGRLIGRKRYGHGSKYFRKNFLPDSLPASDHITLWNKDGRPYILQSQPYQINPEEAHLMVGICEQHGLRFDITGNSFECWYYPGGCVSIIWQVDTWKKVKQ